MYFLLVNIFVSGSGYETLLIQLGVLGWLSSGTLWVIKDKDNLKNKVDLKKEEGIENEDDIKNEDNPKNDDDHKKWRQTKN